MKKYLFAANGLLAVVLGVSSGPSAWAKPSDLPADNKIECTECGEETHRGSITIGLDLFTGRVNVDVKINATVPPPPMAIDSVTPMLVEQLLREVSGYLASGPTGSTDKPAVAQDRKRQAQHLFQIAERCYRTGDFEKARTCYQQVHLLTPTSQLGRSAIDRLSQVEERLRDATEEQDLPAPQGTEPEEAFRNLRQRSIPLGLVELSY